MAGGHQVFIVECFIKTESYVTVQRAFHKRTLIKDIIRFHRVSQLVNG